MCETRRLICRSGNGNTYIKNIKVGVKRVDSNGRIYKNWTNDEDDILFYCVFEALKAEKSISEGLRIASSRLKDSDSNHGSVISCRGRWERVKYDNIDKLVDWSLSYYRKNGKLPKSIKNMGIVKI